MARLRHATPPLLLYALRREFIHLTTPQFIPRNLRHLASASNDRRQAHLKTGQTAGFHRSLECSAAPAGSSSYSTHHQQQCYSREGGPGHTAPPPPPPPPLPHKQYPREEGPAWKGSRPASHGASTHADYAAPSTSGERWPSPTQPSQPNLAQLFPSLPCPALPCPAQPCPALPSPALRCLALPSRAEPS